MIRALVFGETGQLARCLAESVPQSVSAKFVSRQLVDFAEQPNFEGPINDFRPDVILNAAAYTAVDAAETDMQTAEQVNSVAVGKLGAAAQTANVPVIHVSTDYVFSGSLEEGIYGEDHRTEPKSAYGASKLAGEAALLNEADLAFVFRTSWVYSAYGRNFLKTMLALAEERDELSVVGDQVGTPTSAHHIAPALWSVAEKIVEQASVAAKPGIYHMVAEGYCSWYEFALAIFDLAKQKGWKTPSRVREISSDEFKTAAVRPANSRLSTEKLAQEFGIRLPDWHDGIAPVLDRLEDSKKNVITSS